jgi:hypothetical protein
MDPQAPLAPYTDIPTGDTEDILDWNLIRVWITPRAGYRGGVRPYINNLITEVGQGLRFNISEVRAKVRVKRGLASAYRLGPPLCAAPRFRDKDKRRGSRSRDRVT